MSTQTVAPIAPFVATTPCRTRDHSVATGTRRPPRRQPAEISQPWGGRMWPCSAVEEVAFVADLRRRSLSEVSEFDRRDVTALVTALRSGLSADDLLDSARGLKPTRIVAAHRALDSRRTVAVEAWRAIVEAGTADAFELHASAAAVILPAVITQIDRDQRRGAGWSEVIADVATKVARSTAEVLRVEHRLAVGAADGSLTAARSRQAGALLFDGNETGAWNRETFVPSRVTSLVPLRVAALLGEPRAISSRG
jgi:hypothetical protein